MHATAAQPRPLPKFFRPKLTADQQLSAKVIHWDLIERFTNGTATGDDLWDWMETGLTYSQMMQLLAADGVEFTSEAERSLADQLLTYPVVVNRLIRTGRVGFAGAELLTARAAAHVMDELITLDRHGIAEKAALWSGDQMKRLYAGSAMQEALQATARKMIEQAGGH